MRKIMLLCLASLMTTLMWSQAFVDENFSGGVLPAGWTNNDLNESGQIWEFDNPGNRSANSPLSAPFAILDSDNYGSGGIQNAALETPAFDASSATSVFLDFDYYHRQCCGATIYVEVFNGASWIEVHSESSSSANPAHLTLDITTALAGATNAQVRFRYTGDWDYYWIIDNVKIAPPPSCLQPTDLVVASVTTNTADISWTAGDVETDWNVSWGTPGYTPGLDDEGTDIVSTTPAYQITSLDANTEYEFYVQADCGGDESTWSGPVSFTTACDAFGDFTENFDSTTTSMVPNCWNILMENSTSIYASVSVESNSNAISAPNDFQFYNSGDSSAEYYLVSPILNNLTIGDHQLSFFYQGVASGASLVIGTMSDPSDAATFTAVETINTTANYDEYTVLLNQSYSDSHIAFKVIYSTTYNTVYLDNVSWEPIPSCPAPTALTVDSITSNTANISWTAGGSETDWNISWGLPSYTPGTDDSANTEFFQITGLDANTEYEFYVQADCGGDESTWSGPVSFTTTCLAADLPFTQDFESVTVPNIPNCGSLEVNNGNAWATFSTTSYGFNGKVLRYSYHSGGDADSWYFTQGINLNAGVDYQISYQYGNNSTNYTENLKVAYGLSANSAAMTEDIADHTISLSGSEENEATFNVSSDGIYYFGFQSHSISGQFYLYVDNININTAPLCTAPTMTLAAQDASGDPITCLDAGGEYYVLATISGGSGNTSYNVSANSGTPVEVTADGSTVFGPFARGTDVSITATGVQDGDCSVTTAINSPVNCPPANENCAGAIALDCNATPVTYSSSGSTAVAPSGCSIGKNGLWFSFVGTGADITINSSATFDHKMSMQTGSCGELSWIDCKDGSTGAETYTITASVAEQMYYVYVAHWSGTSTTTGDITISIDCAVVPDCTAPTLALATQDGEGDPIEGCVNTGVEYYVLATLSGGEGNTSYNLTANSGDAVEVAADGSVVLGPFMAGTNVSVTAEGIQDDLCSVTEIIASPAICPPSNDDCGGAIPLVCGETITGSTTNATASGLSATCGSYTSSSALDVFYTFEADGTSNYIVSLDAAPGNTFDGVLFVYSGTCGSLTSLGCSDSGNPETMELEAPAAGTYTVRLFRYSGTGDFTLSLDCVAPGFVYEGGVWTPSDPSVDAGPTDDIFVVDGVTSFTSAMEVNNITVMSGATLNVEGTLTINGDITNDGNLVFVSSATANGELAAVPGTSTITGDVTVERYMKAKRSYRMVSSAVTTSTSVHDNWQEGAISNTDNPNAGFGTHITGSTADQMNGFDGTITGNPSMFTVNVAAQMFEAVTNTDVNTLVAGEPYLLFVRGDRSIDLTDDLAAGETVLRATGSLVTGTQTQNYATSNAGDVLMFGNPYQSAVDVNTVFAASTNLNTGYYYVYDSELGAHGSYVTVMLPGGTNTSGSVANQFLQPGQGAQAAALAAGATSVVFDEANKAPGNFTSTSRPVSANDMLTVQLYTTENFNNGGPVHDSFGIIFAEGNDNGLTAVDAVKPMNFYENLGVNNNGTYLSIEQRALPQAAEVYPMYSTGYTKSDYTLKVIVEGLEASFLYLDDHFTGTSILLEAGENSYSFRVDANDPLSIATDRFSIRTEQRLGVDDNSLLAGIRLFPNPLNGDTFYINAPKLNGEQLSVSINDLTGRNIYEQTLDCRANTVTVPIGDNMSSGVYLVTLTNGGEAQTYRLIKE
ncbi:fibronectin type III domain-containing protein [Aequorivita viscosa]|uniref:Por secretion system C-terminal sorting domain-containing protein n=1 Tax=Aequorivita viscosa TaxID=797419 RepID=A0A1M6PEQ6_9FLAO|nr:fibronectin type III domain-containing protein [Aequorivita viscosa]SDX54058.1 Por secretion system C-terminal sorting domain-containing protein [Aequorivita viscosa]SHK06380.1 Por secretion system C-terminal sorting domain-containing protein [Aequorivita viscosa]